MEKVRILIALVLGMTLTGSFSVLAKPAFNSSDIEGPGSQIIFCDLAGDKLKAAVLVDGPNLSVFYQDAKRGFDREPQQRYRLEDRPAVLWPARLGSQAESLLIMTSDGVEELDFTSRTNPPLRRQIIHRQTLIPAAL